MIARLTGTIVEKKAPFLILDVGGVGYEIAVPLTIYEKIPAVNETFTIKIRHIVKENGEFLYGFMNDDEKDLFDLLSTVKGVGDKTVLKFLSHTKAENIRTWIANQDLKSMVTLPGLGNKTASKLLLELNGKILLDDSQNISFDEDALAALIALGYDEKSAKSAIQKVVEPTMKTTEIIQKVVML